MRFSHFPPILIFLSAATLVLGGFEWGRLTATSSSNQNQSGAGGSISLSDASQPADLDFRLFWEAWAKIQNRYFGIVDSSSEKLIEGAIHGMVSSLGDPYTVYLDPQAAKDLGDDLSGVFSGIGAEIGVKNKRLVIIAPLTDSPADEAGLKPKDEINKIDGKSVGDMTFVDAIRLIRGETGTTVTLNISREGFTEPKDFAVLRDKIVVKSVISETKEGNIGYLKVSAFHEDTTTLSKQALDQFNEAGVKGLILDLRGDPGGFLDQAVSMTSLFIAPGTVVKQKSKDGAIKIFETSLSAKMLSTPMVVLVDGGSASASEITAGALQDYGRAKLIGEQTFGKGSVQELENLSNSGQLKITVAQWLTPNDRLINGTGITPDILVANSDADDESGSDPQLERALLELRGN